MATTFYVIGIGNQKPSFSDEISQLIQVTTVFSGGDRHYNLVRDLLPVSYEWVPIKSPMNKVFEAFEKSNQPIIVFASGNPLFYGFANTLRNKYPEVTIQTFPYFSSIQLLANKAAVNSNKLISVSVHGRSWQQLDEVVIKQEELIGVLTDIEKSPAAVANRLLEYGYENYSMIVGEDLEGENERVQEFTLPGAAEMDFFPLNCLLLIKKGHRNIPFGLEDSFFEGLEGRPNMITKMPVRLCSLHALDLPSRKTLWDIGFCTGSLCIEAKIRFPYLSVFAFEKRQECGEIIKRNQLKSGVPGIQPYITDFFEFDLSTVPAPDAVFIGGHGGRLKELMLKVREYLMPGGTVVLNAVKPESMKEFVKIAKGFGWKVEDSLKLKVNSHNEIAILKAVKQ